MQAVTLRHVTAVMSSTTEDNKSYT